MRDTLGVLFLPLRLRSQEGWFSRGPCQVRDATTPRTPSRNHITRDTAGLEAPGAPSPPSLEKCSFQCSRHPRAQREGDSGWALTQVSPGVGSQHGHGLRTVTASGLWFSLLAGDTPVPGRCREQIAGPWGGPGAIPAAAAPPHPLQSDKDESDSGKLNTGK